MAGPELERVKSAASRLHAFFGELQQRFVEREELLVQTALALLSREHVLITGPPGTAKSRLACAILGRIVDEHSGEPSLYSRQFTESTVQTDLVGPLDFKTLMETGRTEHFTDEGMLGAVHAFLDEVFDGRDMLLRSTLNVLHERELKQGTKTTRGVIECAFLTTNRYLAEVLDSSREALLAFVDRVAHVAFVPKGFADRASLERLLRAEAGGKSPNLGAMLTIQDLDALQAATENVGFSPELCGLLNDFVKRFETEIAAAVRADPTFVPTRYLSTRTVLRLAKTLRAACVYDWAINGQTRPLRVQRADFLALRFSLVLCGPRHQDIDALIAAEVDPRERRQLEIVRTERAIFERCLKKLKEEPAVAVPVEPDHADLLAVSSSKVLKSSSTKQLLQTARRLAEACAATALESNTLSDRLSSAVEEIARRAVRSGFETSSAGNLTLFGAADELAGLADEIERLSPSSRPVALWLRGRALQFVQQALRLAPVTTGQNLESWLAGGLGVEQAITASHERLEHARRLLELQTRLIARGAEGQEPGVMDECWRSALEQIEDDLVTLWDAILSDCVENALRRAKLTELGRVLELLRTPLSAVRSAERTLSKLGARGPGLLMRSFGGRLGLVVQASCAGLEQGDPDLVAQEIEGLFDTLDGFELLAAVPAPELLAWVTASLLRVEPDWTALCARLSRDLNGYRTLRAANARRSLVYTLAELCLRLQKRTPTDGAGDVITPIRVLLSGLPDGLRQGVAAAELSRIESVMSLLEGWWETIAALPSENSAAKLALLSESHFMHVTRDEAALARLRLELGLLHQLLPGVPAANIEQRIAGLTERTSTALRDLLAISLDHKWQSTLGLADRA